MVLLNRSTDSGAELIGIISVLRETGRIEGVPRGKKGVSVKRKQSAVQGIGATLGDIVQHTAADPSLRRIVGAGSDVHLLNGFEGRIVDRDPLEQLAIFRTIEQLPICNGQLAVGAITPALLRICQGR